MKAKNSNFWRAFGFTISCALGVILLLSSLRAQTTLNGDPLAGEVQRELSPVIGTNVTVYAENGIVKLVGSVRSLWAKRESVLLTKQMEGVRAVVNLLEVAPVEARNDSLIAEDIHRAVASVPGADVTKVQVYDGRAIVSGRVDTLEHRRQMEDAVGKVEGVIAINDRTVPDERGAMQQSPSPRKTDDELRAAIQDAYFADPRLLYWEPVVNITNGVVTLTGTVSDFGAKRAAAETAANTVGVQLVYDFLQVAGQPAQESDRRLQQQVSLALSRELGQASRQLIVSVVAGTVYLTGTAESVGQRSQIEQIVDAVPGITYMEDDLAIGAQPH